MSFRPKPFGVLDVRASKPVIPGSSIKGAFRSVVSAFRTGFLGLWRDMVSNLRYWSCGFRHDMAGVALGVPINLPFLDRIYRHRLSVEDQVSQVLDLGTELEGFKNIDEYHDRYQRYSLSFHETSDLPLGKQSFRVLSLKKGQQLSKHPFTVTIGPRLNRLFDLVELGFGRKQPSKERVMKRYKEYTASVRIDEEKKTLVGKIEGINDLVTFTGDDVRELEQEFEKAVDSYIRFCKKLGKDPEKKYSGNISLRTDEEIHQEIVVQAAVHNVSVNAWLNAVIKERLKEDTRILVLSD